MSFGGVPALCAVPGAVAKRGAPEAGGISAVFRRGVGRVGGEGLEEVPEDLDFGGVVGFAVGVEGVVGPGAGDEIPEVGVRGEEGLGAAGDQAAVEGADALAGEEGQDRLEGAAGGAVEPVGAQDRAAVAAQVCDPCLDLGGGGVGVEREEVAEPGETGLEPAADVAVRAIRFVGLFAGTDELILLENIAP